MTHYETLSGDRIDLAALPQPEQALIERLRTLSSVTGMTRDAAANALRELDGREPLEEPLSPEAHRIIADLRIRLERATLLRDDEADQAFQESALETHENRYYFTVSRAGGGKRGDPLTFHLVGLPTKDLSFQETGDALRQATTENGRDLVGFFPTFDDEQTARLNEWIREHGIEVRELLQPAFGYGFVAGSQHSKYKKPTCGPKQVVDIVHRAIQAWTPAQSSLFQLLKRRYTQNAVLDLAFASAQAGFAHGLRGKRLGHI